MNDLDRIFDAIQDITQKFKKRNQRNNMEPSEGHFIIIGLGNPGRQYLRTRHNIGFQVLDHLAERLGTSFNKQKAKAMVAESRYQGKRLMLAKPQTYMNKSGFAVHTLVKYYKIPLNHVLIVYDDVDLPLGKLRIKPSGGSGGHKGMKSIIDQFGNLSIPRLRIGIGRPPGKKQAKDYVLKEFLPSEIPQRDIALKTAVDAILEYINTGIDQTMTKFNKSNS
ncbi:MAG TPA: aminoacyl-tRNA hydrolase [Anaerolineae bacterium]|nr:aminoacyl-tRNA hydrolase [Anaerolineae bacterium]